MRGKRYRHFLRQATGGDWPRTVVCLDCVRTRIGEGRRSFVERHELGSWHAVILRREGEAYKSIKEIGGQTCDEFWERLLSRLMKEARVWVYSYRAADQWAMLAGWEAIEMRTAKAELIVIEDPPTILSLRFGRSLVQWVDTLNYGASPPGDARPGIDTARCLADWFIAYAKVCREYKLGSLRPTVGSQAIHGFKCSYYSGGIYNHVHKEATRIEEAGYYGGRCEVFRMGRTPVPVWHYDFRSLYPSRCATTALPVRLRSVARNPSLPEVRACRSEFGIIATVMVQSEEEAYPLRRGGQVIYPVGTFQTTLCGPEFWDADDKGRILKVHEVAYYDLRFALRDYANAIYQLRCAAENSPVAGLSATAKLLCVCLPGKFAQRRYVWLDTERSCDYLYYGQWSEVGQDGVVTRWRSIAGLVQRDADMGLAPDSNLAIAGYITSAGRMALLNAIRQAGWSHTYYCDTDSVMVDAEGSSRLHGFGLVGNRELGKLDLKCGPLNVELRGIKYYVEGKKVVCAGMPAGRIDDIGDGMHYRYHKSPTTDIYKERRPEPGEEIRAYDRRIECRHRVVHSDGSTEPIRLEEGS